MTDTDLYALMVNAVAGEGCKYERGRQVRLLIVCKASSSVDASAAALAPLALAGWTEARFLDVGPLASDPLGLEGVVGDAARYALANGYSIIAYP